MNIILDNLKKYDRNFVKNPLWSTKATRAARNYVYFSKKVDNEERVIGWVDKNFLNGYTIIDSTQLTIEEDGFTKTVWFFETIQQSDNGKIGYRVHSFRDNINTQVSKETGNVMYLMILAKAKEMNHVSVKINHK